jgi:predicted dinucleotide-binding enzyme
LSRDLFAGVPADVVVIDTGNYYQARDGRVPASKQGQPESAWVADQIGRTVLKAFNNISFRGLLKNGRPKGSPDRALHFRPSGDPVEARAKVMRLVTNWASTRLMPAGSMNRSVSSPARRATTETTIRRN